MAQLGAWAMAMATALGLRHNSLGPGRKLPLNSAVGGRKIVAYHTITIPYGIKPLPHGWPATAMAWALAAGHGTSQISKGQGQQTNGHKLGAMAQDIRYPGVRVGEACGPGVAS